MPVLPTPPRRPPRLRRALAAAACGLLLAPALHAADPAPAIDARERGTGTAVAIGGGLKAGNETIYGRLVALAGGPGSRWVVLGTASEDPTASADYAVKQLARRGAVAVALPVSPQLATPKVADAVQDPALLAQVRAARGVFFTGGSQSRIVDHLQPGGRPTPLLQAIWEVYRGGGVVAGTSAGAAIMSTTMFRDAPSVLGVLKGRLREGLEIDRGLGFMGPQLLVDQHFLKRGRLGRLLPLMQAKGYTWGLGIEEDSAAVMRGDTVEILGKALLVNLAEARRDAGQPAFNLSGVRLSLLDSGDTLTLPDGTVTPSPAKRQGQRLEPGAPGYKPYYTEPPFYADFLGDNVVTGAIGLLIDAAYDELRGIAFDPRPAPGDALADLGFEFRLYKGAGSIGWYSDASGGEDYTVRDLRLDLRPIRMAQPMYSAYPAAAR